MDNFIRHQALKDPFIIDQGTVILKGVLPQGTLKNIFKDTSEIKRIFPKQHMENGSLPLTPYAEAPSDFRSFILEINSSIIIRNIEKITGEIDLLQDNLLSHSRFMVADELKNSLYREKPPQTKTGLSPHVLIAFLIAGTCTIKNSIDMESGDAIIHTLKDSHIISCETSGNNALFFTYYLYKFESRSGHERVEFA